MRQSLTWMVLLVLSAVMAPPASSDVLPFKAVYTLELGTFPPVTVSASGVLNASVTGGSNVAAFALPVGVFPVAVTSPVSPPIPLLGKIALTKIGIDASNGAGSFAGSNGAMPLSGTATLFMGFPVALMLSGAVGSAKTVTAKLLGFIPLSIMGNGFTTGTASAMTKPLGGTATAAFAVTRMGGQSFTTTTVGTSLVKNNRFSYVTPSQIQITGLATVATFATLDITISHTIGSIPLVPEPGVITLLATGLVGLALIGRVR